MLCDLTQLLLGVLFLSLDRFGLCRDLGNVLIIGRDTCFQVKDLFLLLLESVLETFQYFKVRLA